MKEVVRQPILPRQKPSCRRRLRSQRRVSGTAPFQCSSCRAFNLPNPRQLRPRRVRRRGSSRSRIRLPAFRDGASTREQMEKVYITAEHDAWLQSQPAISPSNLVPRTGGGRKPPDTKALTLCQQQQPPASTEQANARNSSLLRSRCRPPCAWPSESQQLDGAKSRRRGREQGAHQLLIFPPRFG